MKPAPHILIVEDERKISALMRDYLAAVGYRCTEKDRGAGVVDWVGEKANAPDLVLLDLMLPDADGLAICRAIRDLPAPAGNLPILMVTARVEEIDRLLGLDSGADDYLCKPFSYPELVARVKALLRRAERMTGAAVGANCPTAMFTFDAQSLEAKFQGATLPLTPVEFRLLAALAETPGRVFSRESLIGLLYVDHRIVSDRTIDSHVKNLRRKIAEAGGDENLVRSIYGVGYKMERWAG